MYSHIRQQKESLVLPITYILIRPLLLPPLLAFVLVASRAWGESGHVHSWPLQIKRCFLHLHIRTLPLRPRAPREPKPQLPTTGIAHAHPSRSPRRSPMKTFLKMSAWLPLTLHSPDRRCHRPCPYHTLLPAPPFVPFSSPVSGGRPMCTALGLALGEGRGGPSGVLLIGGVALDAALWGPCRSASPMGTWSWEALRLLHRKRRDNSRDSRPAC